MNTLTACRLREDLDHGSDHYSVVDAARGRRGIWPLAKWAKTRSHLPYSTINSQSCYTIWNCHDPHRKSRSSEDANFSPMPEADLFDILNGSYPLKMLSLMSISEEEISSVIKESHTFKAVGSNGIPVFVLKCLGSPLVSFLKPLFQACIDFSYHPTAFCYCNTVPLRKPGKGHNSVSGS